MVPANGSLGSPHQNDTRTSSSIDTTICRLVAGVSIGARTVFHVNLSPFYSEGETDRCPNKMRLVSDPGDRGAVESATTNGRQMVRSCLYKAQVCARDYLCRQLQTVFIYKAALRWGM